MNFLRFHEIHIKKFENIVNKSTKINCLCGFHCSVILRNEEVLCIQTKIFAKMNFFAMTIEYVSGNSNPLCYVTAHWRLNCPCNDTNNTSRCSREGYESRRIFQMNVFLSSLPSAASIRLITFVRLSTLSCFFLFRGRFHVEMQFTSCLSVTV